MERLRRSEFVIAILSPDSFRYFQTRSRQRNIATSSSKKHGFFSKIMLPLPIYNAESGTFARRLRRFFSVASQRQHGNFILRSSPGRGSGAKASVARGTSKKFLWGIDKREDPQHIKFKTIPGGPMNIALSRAAAAVFLVLSTGSALADAFSTLTVNNVTVTVIDLDPNDGVAASITFLPDPAQYMSGALVRGEALNYRDSVNEPGAQYKSYFNQGAWQTTNVAGSVHTNLATQAGSVTGSDNGIGFSAIDLTGSALSGTDQRSHFWGYASLPGSPSGLLDFTLTANTQVVFSMNASMSASTTIAAPWQGASESASVMLMLYAGGLAADGVTLLEDLVQQGISVPAGGSDSWNGVLSASFSNLGNAITHGSFGANATVQGDSVLAAVPEPSTYAMLLGGLGLLGVLRRRRRAG